jgi:hypothetical protein
MSASPSPLEDFDMSGSRKIGGSVRAALFALVGCIALGCASDTGQQQQASRVVKTSFLKNYSELQSGEAGQALMRYVDPAADFSRYDRIKLDPVMVWTKEGSNLAALPADEIQSLVDHLDASLRASLGRDYELVERPGPGVMRLRVAITEADGAPAVAGTVSGAGPAAHLIQGARKLATGTATFVDTAGVEAELLDSQTEQRLAAAIDRRVVQTSAQSWDDIEKMFDFWADKLAERLREVRGARSP